MTLPLGGAPGASDQSWESRVGQKGGLRASTHLHPRPQPVPAWPQVAAPAESSQKLKKHSVKKPSPGRQVWPHSGRGGPDQASPAANSCHTPGRGRPPDTLPHTAPHQPSRPREGPTGDATQSWGTLPAPETARRDHTTHAALLSWTGERQAAVRTKRGVSRGWRRISDAWDR